MKKTLLLSLLMAAFTMPALAQEEGYTKPQSENFISLQGGAQTTYTNANNRKLVWPVGMLSIGRKFNPVIGARLNVQGLQARGGFNRFDGDHIYNFKYVTTNADAILSLNNLFKPSNNWRCNINLIAGVGFAYAWDKAETNDKLFPLGMQSAWEKDHQYVFNGRVGVQAEWNMSKHFATLFEFDANFLNDKFNGKTNGKCDIQTTAMFGIAYKFGVRSKKRNSDNVETMPMSEDIEGVSNSSNSEAQAPIANDKPVQKPVEQKPIEEKKPVAKEKTETEVFFALGSSTPSQDEEAKISQLAQWLKAHPTAKVDITSFADKATGTAKINMNLSQKRSATIVKLLTEKYGIDASRISSDYKGDTVQPFNENEKNRVTLVFAEEK